MASAMPDLWLPSQLRSSSAIWWSTPNGLVSEMSYYVSSGTLNSTNSTKLTKWHCLVTEASVCEQLVEIYYTKVEQPNCDLLIASPMPTTMSHTVRATLIN